MKVVDNYSRSEGLTDMLYGKFQHPTVIQGVSWPVAMSGRDLIGIAQTGSGKTIAVRLPSPPSLPLSSLPLLSSVEGFVSVRFARPRPHQ